MQKIVKYKDSTERNTILAVLRKRGFNCGHPLVKFDIMNQKDKENYFNGLPFVVDFSMKTFFAVNIMSLAAASSSEKIRKLFVSKDIIIEVLANLPCVP